MPLPEAPLLPGAGLPRPWGTRRRRAVAVGIVAGALASGALLALVVVLAITRNWPTNGPAGNPEFGINFSCNQAEYLLLEDPALGAAGYVSDDRPGRAAWCADVLYRLLTDLGARHVRLSVEWSQVEPRDGVYDFALTDALLQASEESGASVLLSVGIKGQRHPEYYIPGWLLDRLDLADHSDISANPLLRERALEMIHAIVGHAATSPAIEAWLADNEPYHGSPRAHTWYLGREFVRKEVAAIRAADPRARPVVINHAEKLTMDRRWRWALEDADIVGTSIYPFRNYELFGQPFVIDILGLGPFTPNYAARAREAVAAGKQFWITELQAEPWADPDIRFVNPDRPARDLTAKNFRQNLDYARRSGANRVYLWGAEWWLLQRERYDDSTWWEIARAAITGALP